MTGGVALEDLGVGHRGRVVAAGMDAHAEPGLLTAVLGPNGAGKTTLLRTVCGLLAPLAGRVRVGDADVVALDPADRARRISAVLTGTRVPPAMRATDLVALGRHPHTGPAARLGADDHEAVAAALDDVGATTLAARRVGELSDGERQRVLLARALAQDAGVVVLDEPTAFLDAPGRRSLFALLARVARDRDRTVLLCTHEVDLAGAHADHAWLLDRDRRLHTGAPADLPWGWLAG